jgi:cobalt-zinc-cadmium efflux system outer membrane protein
VFDRNQGNAMAAAHDVQAARARKASAELAVRAALARRYQDLVTAHVHAHALGEQTLPAARRAFEGTREGYRRGTFQYLDVLDAQRTLYDLRGRELTALSTYHQARADIERLLGEPLDEEGVIE